MASNHASEPVLVLEPVATLRRAADWIEAGNWCQGDYFSGGRCCVVGALVRAKFGVGSFVKAKMAWPSLMNRVERGAEGEAVQAIIGETLMLHHWNDAPGRTAAEVAAVLRQAATHLEATHHDA